MLSLKQREEKVVLDIQEIKKAINDLLESMEDHVDSLVMSQDFNDSWDDLVKFSEWGDVEELLEVMAQMVDYLDMEADMLSYDDKFDEAIEAVGEVVSELKGVVNGV